MPREKRSRRSSRSRSRSTGPRNDGYPDHHPSLGELFRSLWLDLLTMAILGAIGLGVYFASPAPTRHFPILQPSSNDVVFPTTAYPLRKNIIPIWAAALLAALVPIFFFAIFQFRIRSLIDFVTATIGVLGSLVNAAVFQVFIKWLIGGLRPHFLSVCKPDMGMVRERGGMEGAGGEGFMGLMFTKSICTGDKAEIKDALESMPSGHSTAAFAGFVFLFLYLNAKLKVFSPHKPPLYYQTLLWAPILGAVLIAGSLTIDEFHHWYDVVAGAAIGTAFAFSSFRASYAAVWDWRYNHVPLPRKGGEWGAGARHETRGEQMV